MTDTETPGPLALRYEREIAALKAENERLRKELAITEAQFALVSAQADQLADIACRAMNLPTASGAVAPEHPPSGSKP